MSKIPSIALIPSGYKATKIYSVLPTDGSADLTFDRGTSDDQTRVNSNGLIEDVAVDVPRLDYSDGDCPSLLLEPATTNLFTYSEEFDNVAWTKGGTTISANSVISPKGDLTADTLTEDASSGLHYTGDAIVGASAGSYSFSVFLKQNTRRYAGLRAVTNGFTNRYFVLIDLTNGSVVSTNETGSSTWSSKIEDYGNGWYRLSISGTHSSGDIDLSIGISDSDSPTYLGSLPTYTGDVSESIYIWGAQIEEQSYATSYVPSLGTSGVRQAESASKTGLSSYINSLEGVLYAEYSPSVDSANKQLTLSDGTINERIILEFRDSGTTLRSYSQNSTSFNQLSDISIIDTDSFYKIAFVYNSSELKVYVNGLLSATDSGTIYLPSNLSKLAFDYSSGTLPFYGKTKDLRVYNEALSDLDLARLTGFTSFLEMRSYLQYEAE